MNKDKKSLTGFAWLSITAAILTIALKSYAYWLTGSVGLLSDALESLINLAAAVIALIVLHMAVQPPDKRHAYGHEKVEYFSSGAEGVMILLAAGSIAVTAWNRLLHPQPIQQLDIGLVVSVVAALINLLVARVLLRNGKRYHSITLEADGKHLMTDVWTTVGVVIGVGMIAVADYFGQTGWEIIDPLVAILVAVNITWSGFGLMRRTFAGLMDAALSNEDQASIVAILDQFVQQHHIRYHALRTRQAGSQRFMSVHILVPGAWSVQQSHDLLEQIECRIQSEFHSIDIDTHLEPIEDSASWEHPLCPNNE